MRILIMGAGSLGSVVGGLMANTGHSVTLVGRRAHMDAIARDGLRITGIWGKHLAESLVTRTDVNELSAGAFDLILVTVKSYDTADAAKAIQPLVDANTLVCSYQNGLGNVELLAETVGWERCFGARAIYGAWLPEDGQVDVTVIANPTALGTYRPETPAERVREIATAMDESGMPTVYTDSIATVLWSKVAYNCAMNALSAMLDVPYGKLLNSEETRTTMRDVTHELYLVGHALGVHLEPSTPEAYIDLLFNELIPPTALHYASMREDFRRRRRTEIDALNGAICRYGDEHGIPCPVNERLTREVRAREESYLAAK